MNASILPRSGGMEWNVMSLPLKDKDEDHYPYPARLRSATHSSPSSQLLSVGSTSSTPTRRRRPFLPQLLLLALALIAITSIFNYPSSLLPPPSFAQVFLSQISHPTSLSADCALTTLSHSCCVPAFFANSTLEKALDLPTTAYFGDPDLVTSHSVWGAGLNSAVQFEYATFFIDFVDSNGLNSTEAGPLRKEEDMIVTLSGPSLFPAQVKYLSEGRYVVRYRAIDAGTYHLSVTIFKRPAVHKSPYIFWLPLGEQAGYQVEVLKHDRTSVLGDPRAGIEMPKNVCTQVGQNSYGRWLRCEDAKLPCVRYGWVWVNHDCFYPVIDPAEIARQNKWILYIGTRFVSFPLFLYLQLFTLLIRSFRRDLSFSVKRGSFLTALDSLLGDQAHNLTTSRFNKCHGWLDARVDHLRISYLDLRRQCYSLPQEKICSTPNYPDAAETMLRKLGSEHGGPDLVVTEVNYNYDNGPSISLTNTTFPTSCTHPSFSFSRRF